MSGGAAGNEPGPAPARRSSACSAATSADRDVEYHADRLGMVVLDAIHWIRPTAP
jgi:hypothetical protein